MKFYILLSLLFCSISCQLLGPCAGTPKKRPIECYQGLVLKEDLPELKELLERYKDGDDHEFALYLEDMLDKKDFREGKTDNEHQGPLIIGKCGVAPKYLPFECYEKNVLKRHKEELKELYDKYHRNNLEVFNSLYFAYVKIKEDYFAPK